MVNRDQDVMDRVQNKRGDIDTASKGSMAGTASAVHTGPLHDVFEHLTVDKDDPIEPTTNDVLKIDIVDHRAHVPAGNPEESNEDGANKEGEGFNLFKLQDEEPTGALEPTKEHPADWEPDPA